MLKLTQASQCSSASQEFVSGTKTSIQSIMPGLTAELEHGCRRNHAKELGMNPDGLGVIPSRMPRNLVLQKHSYQPYQGNRSNIRTGFWSPLYCNEERPKQYWKLFRLLYYRSLSLWKPCSPLPFSTTTRPNAIHKALHSHVFIPTSLHHK